MQPQNLVQKRTHRVANYWEMWWDCRVRGGIEHMQQLNESARERNQPNVKEKKTTWERIQVCLDCGREEYSFYLIV